MRKKLIGVLVTQASHPETYKGQIIGIEEQYLKMFSEYGRVVAIMPDMKPSDIKLDLLVLPGGADLDTSFTCNGDDLVVGNGTANPMYSQFYRYFLPAWLKARVPVFGICLGFQALNVCLGGGLTSDGPNHAITGYHPITAFNEKLKIFYTISAYTKGVEYKRPERIDVNSRHHQFVQPHQLAKCLLPVALGVMNDDFLKTQDHANSLWEIDTKKNTASPGLLQHFYNGNYKELNGRISHIEAFVHASQKIAGVQWHPESMWRENFKRGDEVSHKMITWLLEDDNSEVAVGVESNPVTRKYEKV